ncbi:MAG: polysaccharide biosynthesis tyrosine autokinase [Nostocaceae cyanobacterium]|nr:polysaccharide biosynthesis tyrosine autokinase [Nostocaceae cyanobacterium]
MLREERPLPLSTIRTTQYHETDEGGLNLGQVAAAIRRRALVIVAATGVVASAAVYQAKQVDPVYQGKFEILTKPVTGETQVIANVPQALNTQEDNTQNQVQTTIKVLTSPGVLEPVIKKLQIKYPDITYGSISKNLSIVSKAQNILEVQYTHADQQQVQDVLSGIAEAFLNYSLAERQAEVDLALDFVQDRITRGGLKRRVDNWQMKLQNLRQKHNLVEPLQKAQEVSAQIATLTQQQRDVWLQLEQMRFRYQQLQRELTQHPNGMAATSILNEMGRYQSILNQIQTLDIEIKKQSARYFDESPNMITLRETRVQLLTLLNQEQKRLQREFQNSIRDLETRGQLLTKQIDNLNQYLKQLAQVNREYDNIQRELTIATNNLNQFLTKQQALEIEKSQKVQPWKLLNPAVNASKIKPEAFPVGSVEGASTSKNLAMGAMLGLMLGVGAALVMDKLSNVFYTAKDLKEALRLPILGVIPFRKELSALPSQDNIVSVVQQASRTFFFEVFRSLYTNILLLSSDAPINSLVISSAGQQDGKSTVAVHLALAAAAMGQKVLLVDANLRAPNLHHRVGLMNIQGLTDVISQDLDWHNVIERSPLEENLFVLAAGPVPPDSIRLLASQKMQDLMNELQEHFDLVIYDSPPLLGFADAHLLAANTNGVVLVAGLGKVKRTVLQQALEELQVSGTPLLGAIANGSKEPSPTSDNYYQEYYKRNLASIELAESTETESINTASFSLALKKIMPTNRVK